MNNTNSGSAPAGIQAGYNSSGGTFNPNVFGDVFVIDNANINAAAGDGINAYNYGVGNVSVNVGFNTSIVAQVSATSLNVNGNAPFGIGAFNYGHGDIHVTMSGGDFIQSGSSGINAANQWHPTTPDQSFALVTVSAAGSIHSGSINNNSSATSLPAGITAGFLGDTTPTPNLNLKGNVIVNNAANITADAGYGIKRL